MIARHWNNNLLNSLNVTACFAVPDTPVSCAFGEVGGYRFRAWVSQTHWNPVSEQIGDTRILHLYACDPAAPKRVINFLGRWNTRPETPTEFAIVGVLCKHLASQIYGPM